MMYLENTLHIKEEITFLNWLYHLEVRPEELCNMEETERRGKYILDVEALDNLLSTKTNVHLPRRDTKEILTTLDYAYSTALAKVVEKLLLEVGRRKSDEVEE